MLIGFCKVSQRCFQIIDCHRCLLSVIAGVELRLKNEFHFEICYGLGTWPDSSVRRLLEERVNRYLENWLKHTWNDSCQQGTAYFNARVRIYFYEFQLEVIVYHKIIAENLKCIHASLGIDLFLCCAESVPNYSSYLGKKVSLKSDFVILKLIFGEVTIEILVRKLVSILKFPVIFRILLNGIIC